MVRIVKSDIMFPNEMVDVMTDVIIPKDEHRSQDKSRVIIPKNGRQMVINQDKPQDSDIPTIIDADKFMAMTLDDISIKLDKLVSLSIKNQETLSSLLDYTIKNEKRLASIQNELIEEADAGAVLRSNGTVTPTQFIIIDTNKDPGHMVKGYTVRNDGPNNIFVGHNAAISSNVDADIIDVISGDISRFEEILPNEDIKFVFNRRRIRNIHILAQGGNSSFRVWLVW